MNKFEHFPHRPKKLTASFAASQYQKLVDRIKAAELSDEPNFWIKLFEDWNELSSYVSSEGGRIDHAFNRNMRDKKIEAAEDYFREKIVPKVTEPEYQLTLAFLNSKHRQAIANYYGKQLITIYETQLKPLDPINTKLRIRASRLCKKYDQTIAQAEVEVRDEKMTLVKASSLLTSDDESLRKEAFWARGDWFLKNRTELSKIYSQLVGLRHQMAKNLGYKNYIPLAYQIMGRSDYDEALVAKFRASVLKHVVPLRLKILEDQTKTLGKKSLKPWDAGYNPSISLPRGIVPPKTQLDKARKLFARLSPILAKHFKFMLKHDLIDLANRPGKRAGAYCTEFSDQPQVVVFCNSVGDAEDIETLTHEMGHAFQGWESTYIKAVDLRWATAELAEIYSMGMEFLCLPYIEIFFDRENAEKFRKGRWIRTINIICYVCVVDEFQHWVYANPKSSPNQRDKKWIELSDKYMGGIDWKGVSKYRKTRWYAQGHIFDVPFYYIDYGLAEVVAMQLAVAADKNHEQTLQKYLGLCKLGGAKSFLEALKYGSLESPFDEQLILKLVKYAKKQLF